MDNIKRHVRESYAEVARKASSGCWGDSSAEDIGYSRADIEAAPENADMGLGCGNPTAIADLKPGETVLDLGSGGGFDCFLAANAVGPEGTVIGVDMTEEMIATARANAEQAGYVNVEFRLGEIEDLPIDDASVDVVISNCVINLVPDKKRAFEEVYRVLKPAGRLHVSDIVTDRELPEALLDSEEAYVGCVAGAVSRQEYLDAITAAGLNNIDIVDDRDATALLQGCCQDDESDCGCSAVSEGTRDIHVSSITVSALKPP